MIFKAEEMAAVEPLFAGWEETMIKVMRMPFVLVISEFDRFSGSEMV